MQLVLDLVSDKVAGPSSRPIGTEPQLKGHQLNALLQPLTLVIDTMHHNGTPDIRTLVVSFFTPFSKISSAHGPNAYEKKKRRYQCRPDVR